MQRDLEVQRYASGHGGAPRVRIVLCLLLYAHAGLGTPFIVANTAILRNADQNTSPSLENVLRPSFYADFLKLTWEICVYEDKYWVWNSNGEKWFYVEEPLVHWTEFAVFLTTHGVPIQHSVGGTMLTQGVGLRNSRGCSAAGGLCYVASPALLISSPP